MRYNAKSRPRPTGASIPKAGSLPCVLHPNALPYKSKGNGNRCSECFRIQRRARFDAMGDSIGTRYANARWQASRREQDFDITIEQYSEIIARPCVYAIHPNDVQSGIDRKDSGKGYTLENCQPCCPRHNLFKSDILTHEQALDAVKRYAIPCGTNGAGRKRKA